MKLLCVASVIYPRKIEPLYATIIVIIHALIYALTIFDGKRIAVIFRNCRVNSECNYGELLYRHTCVSSLNKFPNYDESKK